MAFSAEADIVANIPRVMGRTPYDWHEAGQAGLEIIHASVEITNIFARIGPHMMRSWGFPVPHFETITEAAAEFTGRFAKDYTKPQFGITETIINGDKFAVEQITEIEKPFGSLIHFERDTDREDPKVLLVAPMAGHYSTMLRGTAQGLLDHGLDVHMTDWNNARDVPISEGDFGLEDYVDYVEEFIKELGPEVHVVAVCQATVPTLAAVAHLADKDSSLQPRSMTLMAGPLDTRVAPTAVSELADAKSMEWFKKYMVDVVPNGYEGAGRLVHPGFMQLAGFMAMHLGKHVGEHMNLFGNRILGRHEDARKMIKFYDEYFAVADMSGQFYLETVDSVFKERELAEGRMKVHGDTIYPAAIKDVHVMTIEGGKDDITAPGQTSIALDWLTGVSKKMKYQYLQPDSGHYGVFEGSKWRTKIAPKIGTMIMGASLGRKRQHAHSA